MRHPGEDHIDADTDAVRRSATPFGGLGDTLRRSAELLGSTLDGEGSCWGNDQYGDAFLTGYSDQHEAIGELFPNLAAAVGGIEPRLTANANNYDTVEAENESRFRS